MPISTIVLTRSPPGFTKFGAHPSR
jgi:hypothetical protein